MLVIHLKWTNHTIIFHLYSWMT